MNIENQDKHSLPDVKQSNEKKNEKAKAKNISTVDHIEATPQYD